VSVLRVLSSATQSKFSGQHEIIDVELALRGSRLGSSGIDDNRLPSKSQFIST
jgi:hypothetical protein